MTEHRRLIALVSTKGKSPEEAAREAFERFRNWERSQDTGEDVAGPDSPHIQESAGDGAQHSAPPNGS